MPLKPLPGVRWARQVLCIVGASGSVAAKPALGTLRAGIETLKTAKGLHYCEISSDELQPQNRRPD
jgi:hypothetical protein